MSEGSRSSGLFAVGGEVFGWTDVVALARLRGDWGELAARVGHGLAALEELSAQGEPVVDEEIDEAARRFRYGRDLLAGDELAGWLERTRLTTEDWHAYLSRQLARERLPATAPADPGEPDEAAIWAEGICSGRLEELARELADLAAVSPGTPLDRLDASFAAFRDAAVDADAEAREVEANRLEWLRLAYEAVVAEDAGAAFEAALCVRVDGESVRSVSDRASLAVDEGECWLDELEPALATRFLAATPGEVVGPVPVEGGFVVAHVRSKTAPSLEDEPVRARAHEAALSRAVSRLVADRVVWL